MNAYSKTIRIELKKFKSQGLYLTWICVTAALVCLMLYEGRNGITHSPRMVYETRNTYYYSIQMELCMIFGLALPVLSSVLASKLIDEESLHNTWILLRCSNQEIGKLYDVKFGITYFLVETTTAIVYIAALGQLFFLSHFPVPVTDLTLGFLALSAVNFYVTVTVYTASLYSQNQIVPIVIGILLGIVGVVSPLLPLEVDKYIPYTYYALCMLAGNKMTGVDAQGLNIWLYFPIKPPYLLIGGVAIFFLLLFFLLRFLFVRREV